MFKTLLSLAGFLIAFIPTWIFLIIKHVANPEGFWQNLVLFGLGFWIGGAIQLLLVALLLAYLLFVWTEL